MTEVLKSPTVSFSNNFPSERPVLSVKHYEASPPVNLSTQLVDPENVLSTTKEEEWVTKKKTEVTTKKQIETRVKRQVVLEDGKVVEDSGPIVTTNTTEDTEKQEHEQTEHRQIGDDAPGDGWVAVPNTNGLVKEVRENKVKSREETEELLETEDVQHLGDITDEAYLKAIQSQRKDLRLALRQASSELLSPGAPNGRIVHQSKKNRKVIDSENTKHLSEIQGDGRLITETTKTTEHEEVNNTAEPDDDDVDESDEYETHNESSQRYRKTKDQEVVQYLSNGVKIGEEMRFEAENVEGDRRGDPESLKIDSIEWESLSERIRRMRREKQQKLEEAERMDALTKKPLNFDQEEETRKVETSKWLEHHFGSESRSSHSSSIDDDEQPKKKTSSSFINVTMKSTKAQHEQNAPSSQQPTNAFYKGISEWNGNSSRHSVTNGFHKFKSEPPKSPITAKKNVYDVQNGSVKKVASEERPYSAFQPVNERTKSSSKYYTEHTSSPISSPISELESSPLYASIQQKYNDKTSSSYDVSSSSHYAERSSTLNGHKNAPNGILRSTSPVNQYNSCNGVNKTENNRPERKSSMIKREYMNKSWSRSERRLTDISDSDVQREPDPDYSPRLRRKVPSSPDVRSSPLTDTMRKKVYQKTRFSAEIPMIKRAKPTNVRPERKSSSLGDTFRKIIGKFQGNSADRKRKSQHRSNGVDVVSNGSVPHSARNQNSHYSSYQAFNSVDNHITDNDTPDVGDTDRSGRDSPLQPKQAVKYASFEEPLVTGATTTSTMTKKRVTTSSPSIVRRSSMTNGSQTLDRNYRAKKRHEDNMSKRSSPAQKYYLGEDPFNGSIYGKEKEYDGAKPFRRKYKNGNSTDDEKKSVKSHILNGVNNILGGRLSKSTSKLTSDSNHRARRIPIDYTDRGVQTLPRKSKKQVFINDPHSDQENLHSRRSLNNQNSGSMINVSVVNNRSPSFKSNGGSELLGPQKPARTYRSSLLRSKSFNVQLGPSYGYENSFKSNPQLHKLDKLEESPPPLKSPSIVTSISRSTRDLSKSFDDDYRSDFAKSNGYAYDGSRRPFLKGLKSRAPELYKTLHEDDEFDSSRTPSRLIPTSTPLRSKGKVEYSNSFHSGNTRKPTVSFESDRYSPQSNKNYSTLTRRSPDRNGDVVNRSVSRNGSNDDYSETVRITSKSTDPLRPSVTDTVQSFSKKTLPSKDGRMETIESSETTRVTKSHYRGDGENDRLSNKYNSKNGSTVVELRNGKK